MTTPEKESPSWIICILPRKNGDYQFSLISSVPTKTSIVPREQATATFEAAFQAALETEPD